MTANTDLRPGDRVRVTFEGEVNRNGGICFGLNPDADLQCDNWKWLFVLQEPGFPAATIEKLSPPARPLEVGEVVIFDRTSSRNPGEPVEILAAYDNLAWAIHQDQKLRQRGPSVVSILNLSRPCGTPITPAKE